LAVANPLPVLMVMLERGIFQPVLPELVLGRLADLLAAEAAAGVAPDWLRRLAAMLPTDRPQAEAVAFRLRLSNVDRGRLGLAVLPADATPVYAAAWTVGANVLLDRLLIAGRVADAQQLMAWERPRMPVSGRDFVARGVGPGPEVAARLQRFERDWVAAGFPNDAAAVSALIEAALTG
jgi:poly(A) polymerase